MVKALVQIISSLFFGVMGTKFILTYLQELKDDGSKPALLIIALALLIICGVFSFNVIRDYLKTKKAKTEATADFSAESLTSTLEKNNAMTDAWKKTNDTRDKLKLLQISAQAEE